MTDKSCKFPWTWRNVKIQSDDWRFCCKTEYKDHSASQIILKNVQDAFEKKEQHPRCNACWLPEHKGYNSYRTTQWGITSHEKIVNFYSKKPSIEWIDIEVGDTCNMYCMTCGPNNSTLWQQMTRYYPNDNTKLEQSLPKLFAMIEENIESLNRLNIYGGEPSVDPNFHVIVDKLINYKLKKPIKIQIYTNGNYSDNHRVKFEKAIDLLKDNGWNIDLNFSLDAVGENVEFIRGGLAFNRFEKNLTTAIEKGFRPYVNISTSILNLEIQPEIYHWSKSAGLHEKIIPKLNIVSKPYEFNLSVLGNKLSDFLPNWPDMPEEDWKAYKDRLDTHLAVTPTYPPDKNIIKILVGRFNQMSQLSGKPIPEYYQRMIQRLSDI
jgi:hypothetical protein